MFFVFALLVIVKFGKCEDLCGTRLTDCRTLNDYRVPCCRGLTCMNLPGEDFARCLTPDDLTTTTTENPLVRPKERPAVSKPCQTQDDCPNPSTHCTLMTKRPVCAEKDICQADSDCIAGAFCRTTDYIKQCVYLPTRDCDKTCPENHVCRNRPIEMRGRYPHVFIPKVCTQVGECKTRQDTCTKNEDCCNGLSCESINYMSICVGPGNTCDAPFKQCGSDNDCCGPDYKCQYINPQMTEVFTDHRFDVKHHLMLARFGLKRTNLDKCIDCDAFNYCESNTDCCSGYSCVNILNYMFKEYGVCRKNEFECQTDDDCLGLGQNLTCHSMKIEHRDTRDTGVVRMCVVLDFVQCSRARCGENEKPCCPGYVCQNNKCTLKSRQTRCGEQSSCTFDYDCQTPEENCHDVCRMLRKNGTNSWSKQCIDRATDHHYVEYNTPCVKDVPCEEGSICDWNSLVPKCLEPGTSCVSADKCKPSYDCVDHTCCRNQNYECLADEDCCSNLRCKNNFCQFENSPGCGLVNSRCENADCCPDLTCEDNLADLTRTCKK